MKATHTWCTKHHCGTTRWAGTYGRNCAYGSRQTCTTELRPGVVKYWDENIGHWVDAVDGTPWLGSRVDEYAAEGRK